MIAARKTITPCGITTAGDSDEKAALAGVQKCYVIADASGHVLNDAYSSNYEELGLNKPAEIRSVLQANGAVFSRPFDSDRVQWLVRESYVNGEDDPGLEISRRHRDLACRQQQNP